MSNQRLDQVLVARGLAATRSRARALIDSGSVSIAGQVVTKVATRVPETASIAVAESADNYVSRGATKLCAALEHFALSPAGRVALDVGSSTGGFTEVLLERGAAKVYAVDVGRDQLHPRMRARADVVSLEGVDARKLTRQQVPDPIDFIVADISFISLTKALGPALDLSSGAAHLVALIKPQFEAGRDAVGKGGIVRSNVDRERAVETVREWVLARGDWDIMGVIPSPITGGDGNVEFLIAARRV
jgi:23S rRNA (cytidine1920-2'-O)/16S rRNA (cytidine1409-2'-O)-methyltransferase